MLLAFTIVDGRNRARLLVSNVPSSGADLRGAAGPGRAGSHEATFVLPPGLLPAGVYRISVFLGTPGSLLNTRDVSAEDVIHFNVLEGGAALAVDPEPPPRALSLHPEWTRGGSPNRSSGSPQNRSDAPAKTPALPGGFL